MYRLAIAGFLGCGLLAVSVGATLAAAGDGLAEQIDALEREVAELADRGLAEETGKLHHRIRRLREHLDRLHVAIERLHEAGMYDEADQLARELARGNRSEVTGPQRFAVTVHAGATAEPISKYVYGQFIEHQGRCIYGGIWAEMIRDRKFCYPVNHHFPWGEQKHKSPWRAREFDTAVVMDPRDSFVGEHTPRIDLDGRKPRAGAQGLLPLEHVVVFNNNGRRPPTPNVYPLFRLSERFALVEDFYTPATLDASFADNLRRSKVLYIGQYSDESPLFADPDLCEVIKSYLKRGGLVVFDYHTGSRGVRFQPETEQFLKSVGVIPPADFHPGYGKSQFRSAKSHVLLSEPAPIGGKPVGHYGWWQRWTPEQTVLAYDRDDKDKATLIIQEGVLGKGAVVFNQLPSAFRAPEGVYFDLVHNIIAYAYGKGRQSQ